MALTWDGGSNNPDPSKALDTIDSEWNQFKSWANDSLLTARDYVSSTGLLKTFTVTQEDTTLSVSTPSKIDVTAGFTKPTDPGDNAVSFDGTAVSLPSDPAYKSLTDPTLEDGASISRPVLNYTSALTLSAKPDALSATAPGDAPSTGTVTLTDDIALPLLTVPSNTFSFTEVEYSSTVLTEVQDKLVSILQSGLGIPTDVEEAIYNRAKSREDKNAAKALQEVTESWSARGFSIPGGELTARQDEIRQGSRDAANQLSREVLVQQYQTETENLRLAVTSGVQLENAMVGAHMQVMQRAFEKAVYSVEVSINLYNAEATLYNLKLEAYKVNQAGDRSALDAERLKLDGFRTKVEAYAQQVAAKRDEYQAWQSEMQGMLGVASLYEADLRAALTKNELKLQPERWKVEQNAEKLKEFLGGVEKATAALQKESARVQTEAASYDANLRAFATRTDAENARVGADVASYRASLDFRRTEVDTAVQQLRTSIDQVQQTAALELDGMKAAAASATQLSTAPMSALHLAASSSFSGSESKSNSYSLSDSRSQQIPY